MKTIDNIPTSKIQRASKLLKTGAKVGVNYVKYYGNKLVGSEEEAREQLDRDNASDIYDSLKELKGSALKMAQMLSMDKSFLPQAYVEKFSLSQFSVPPLSPPLVMKTFRKYFGKNPNELFDSFNPEAINGASIGQVHMAAKDGQKLAVKIQYPGVAESISSDLALVKPIAMRMFNLKGADSEKYFREVEDKLLEETDYELELRQSKQMAEACQHLEGLKFPQYYEEFSSDRIITMDWMEGQHLSEFAATNTDPELANKVGQALWNFYMYQMHDLRMVHADPHPGNFLVTKDGDLVVLDFGCVKHIPDDFYGPFFDLVFMEDVSDTDALEQKLRALQILRDDDSEEEKQLIHEIFTTVISLFALPLREEKFDFSDQSFFDQLIDFGKNNANNSALRKMNGNRGVEHFVYVNRAFFGLYSLMNDIKADNIDINLYQTV